MRRGAQRAAGALSLLAHQQAAGLGATAAAWGWAAPAAAAAAAAAAARGRAAAAARPVSSLASVIAAEQGKTRLQGYLPSGFILNNTQVEGPVLCLPEMWLLWDAPALAALDMAALPVLDLMAPPPEVLVVGCGARLRRLPEELMRQLRGRGIAVEVLDTRNAISYFNFLNDEGRIVVGALLPVGEDGGGGPE
ncbi:hypothetical protein Rsub_12298 [Raphidocelis subcapitata]|uniref:NADH dehydrogenase [ubiquinone] 1 alpha subcomplex assembly factor 3 n=1 Tax=Raphidocelis subcapitata TaxID=307507 RepID=A0A2V0PJ92_9CHLO|nr:hypothetical protein Rsub_12298 [Raphidocelis subcapitata]|eukprot:GBF99619.1 hypothetical protein Rsub_12298 [Raphidocelis subcapitata]